MAFFRKMFQRLVLFGSGLAVVPFLVVADLLTIVIEFTTRLRGPWSVRLAVFITSALVIIPFVSSGGMMMMSRMLILQPTLQNPFEQFEIQISLTFDSTVVGELVTLCKLLMYTCIACCICIANMLVHLMMYPVLAFATALLSLWMIA